MTIPKLNKPCSTHFRAVHSSGPRKAAQIKNVCIHSTEGDTAEGAASWFANPKSGGSANLVIDNVSCFKTLPDLVIPWAAPGLNTQGFHVELAGHAAWSRAQWLDKRQTLDRAAYKVAQRCALYKIPPRWVGPIGLRLGVRGLTTHRAVTYAWPILARKAGWHTDPGTGFPRDVFLSLVKTHLAEIQA